MENSDLSKRKRAREFRTRKGLTQEELAENSGLSLRTIQRIENGEVMPRGDSLKRIAVALQVTPDDLIEWQVLENKNVITMLNLSQLGFLVFPLIGIIIPLVIWIQKKDKVKNVQDVGRSILNFQITWTLILFLFLFVFVFNMFIPIVDTVSISWIYIIIAGLYIYNCILIILNTIRYGRSMKVFYKPAFRLLQ